MNTKDVSKLLEESYTKLNLTPETVYEGKKYSIVDFCLEHLQMSNEDTIKFCQAHLSAFPTFTVKNEMLLEAGVLSKIGDGIRNAAQRITGNGVRPAPTNKPTALNVPAKLGNFFGTDTSVVRNSPMLKIVDPDMLTAKYLVFPKLDLTRPGHRRILQDIENIEAGKKNANGKPMQVSPVPDTERGAALASRSKVTVDTPMDDQNKQKDVVTALDKLSALIQTTKKGLESGRAVSAEELTALKGQVAAAVGGFDAAAAKSNVDDPAKDQAVVAKAEQQINSAAPASTTTPTPAADPKAPGAVSPTGGNIPTAAPAGTPPPTGLVGAMKAQYAAAGMGAPNSATPVPLGVANNGNPASTPAAISPTPVAATSNPAPTAAPATTTDPKVIAAQQKQYAALIAQHMPEDKVRELYPLGAPAQSTVSPQDAATLRGQLFNPATGATSLNPHELSTQNVVTQPTANITNMQNTSTQPFTANPEVGNTVQSNAVTPATQTGIQQQPTPEELANLAKQKYGQLGKEDLNSETDDTGTFSGTGPDTHIRSLGNNVTPLNVSKNSSQYGKLGRV